MTAGPDQDGDPALGIFRPGLLHDGHNLSRFGRIVAPRPGMEDDRFALQSIPHGMG
jgi:hypothetical protein